jgi:peptidyl-prolyl cis-trans isomerase D
MLDVMRKQSSLIYLIFGGIIVIFAFNFGPGSGACSKTQGPQPWAAKVRGEEIRQQDFALAYSRHVDYMRRNAQQSGIEFTEEMAERFGLRTQVMDSLIERKLLGQEAQRRHMQVSDADLLNHLKTRYGVDNVTYDQYENWVRRTFDMSVARFEEEARLEIMGQKLVDTLESTLTVSDAELLNAYKRTHDRAMLTYVRFEADASMAEPSAEDITRVNTQEAQAVKAYYDAHVGQYQTPAQVHVRQILKKVPMDADEAAVNKARESLVALAKQLASGADFASLAKTHSEDETTASKGGDLGFIKQGDMAKTLVDAAFALEKGKNTPEPVRTPQGWHLLKTEERKEAAQASLDAVKSTVAKDMLKERASEASSLQKAQAFLTQLRGAKGIDALTRLDTETSNKPVRQETPWFTRFDEGIPGLGMAPDLQAHAFNQTKESPLIDKPYKVGSEYVVAVLKDREIPNDTTFAQSKEQQKEQLLWDKRSKVMKDWLKHLRKEAQVEVNQVLVGPRAASS